MVAIPRSPDFGCDETAFTISVARVVAGEIRSGPEQSKGPIVAEPLLFGAVELKSGRFAGALPRQAQRAQTTQQEPCSGRQRDWGNRDC